MLIHSVLEQRPEVGHDVADKIRHTLERFENRITLNNPRFAERYIKQEIYLLVHFRIGGINKEFVAYLEREHPVGGSEIEFNRGRLRESVFLHERGEYSPTMCSDVHGTECGTHGNQQAVLVGAVESMEPPEGVIPSLVWFDSVDGVYGVLPHSMYFSVHSGLVFRGVIENRKVNMLGVGGIPRSDSKQPIGQMVKRTSEVMKGISRDTGDIERDRLNIDEEIDQLSRLRITLGRDFIGATVLKSEDCRLQLLDMLVGPFDFKAD